MKVGMENKQERELGDAVKRILAIFAFVVVIAIGIFGSLALASAVPNVFSGMAAAVTSVFSGSETEPEPEENPTPTNQSIVVSAPGSVADGQTFTLSWGHTGKTQNGVYAFRYDCAEGLSFTFPTSQAAIACGQPFVLDGTGSIALVAASQTEPAQDAFLSIDFIPEGQSVASVSGSATLSVTYTAPETNTGNGGGTTTTTIPVTSDPNGYTDLTVRFVSVGAVNRTTGTFYPVSYPSRSSVTDRIAVRFEVKNEGTKTSPQWFFRANLPTQQSATFNSQAQTALRPGESIIFTLAFDGFINSTQGTASVTVDPSNYVTESNESNNYAAQIINTTP